ncbi:glutamate racemase [Ruminococcaceae bacterium YRB3002]|nr:glutamate racemase [Ruminococcaceae bacterium YRB3002]
MADNRPIGVFDSGIGGLTVLREIWDMVPSEGTIYFGDNGRAPYGTKSKSTIIKYSLQDMSFLEEQNVKMIVIACNTASAHAYEALKERADVPVIEVVTPGARCAARATKNGRIGIIATKGSVNSGVYKAAVEKEAPEGSQIFQQACPLFVSLAEEGWWDNEITDAVVKEYLTPLKEAGIDTLVLGCTHYPLLTPAIRKFMGDGVTLINAGKAVAEVVRKTLADGSLMSDGVNPVRAFYTSDEPELFESVASPFLGRGLPAGTKHCNIDRYSI